MINKPAISGKPPITITGSGYASNAVVELIAVHYLNTTAGAGRVDIRDGGPAGEIRITLGADAANGNDDFCPVQPAKFLGKIYVAFTTGTGIVTLLFN